MRTTVGSSRRVGVWAARNRATPVRISADSSDPSGHAMRLPRRRLEHLEPVELGVLGEQRVTERGDQLVAAAAAPQEPVGDRPASSTAPCTSQHAAARRASPLVDVRQPGRGDVEEAVEVDAQRAVHEPAEQLGRRLRGPAPGAARSRR